MATIRYTLGASYSDANSQSEGGVFAMFIFLPAEVGNIYPAGSPEFGAMYHNDGRLGYQPFYTENYSAQLFDSSGGYFIDYSDWAGDLRITGGRFGDVIRGGEGTNTLNGAGGNDVLEGGAVADILDGGAGIDTASYEHATTGINVQLGYVPTYGGAAGERLNNIENLRGGDFDDSLVGDDGNNTIEGGLGQDYLNGYGGIDTVSYEHSAEAVRIDLRGSAFIGASEFDGLFGFENATGSAHADSISGTDGANVLNGLGGNDTLIGSKGSDTYFVDSTGDVVTEANNTAGGSDTVFAYGSYTLGAGQGIEVLRARGTAGATLIGNELKNSVYGSVGNDTIAGGAGQDSLVGAAGADTFVFTAVSDSNAAARDTIRDFVSGTDTIDLSGIATGAVDGHFHFDGGSSFTKQKGELIVTKIGGATQVQGDTNGDGRADLLIVLSSAVTLTAGDFDLV